MTSRNGTRLMSQRQHLVLREVRAIQLGDWNTDNQRMVSRVPTPAIPRAPRRIVCYYEVAGFWWYWVVDVVWNPYPENCQSPPAWTATPRTSPGWPHRPRRYAVLQQQRPSARRVARPERTTRPYPPRPPSRRPTAGVPSPATALSLLELRN